LVLEVKNPQLVGILCSIMMYIANFEIIKDHISIYSIIKSK